MVTKHTGKRAPSGWVDPVQLLDPADLEDLLRAEVTEVVGLIMALNRRPHYHNRLDAFALMLRVNELRRERGITTRGR